MDLRKNDSIEASEIVFIFLKLFTFLEVVLELHKSHWRGRKFTNAGISKRRAGSIGQYNLKGEAAIPNTVKIVNKKGIPEIF